MFPTMPAEPLLIESGDFWSVNDIKSSDLELSSNRFALDSNSSSEEWLHSLPKEEVWFNCTTSPKIHEDNIAD